MEDATSNIFGTPAKSPSKISTPSKSPSKMIALKEEFDNEDDNEDRKDDSNNEVVDTLPPVVITQYTSSQTSETIALVLLTLPSGVTSCHVALDLDDMSEMSGGTNKVRVSYEWGEYSFNPLAPYCKLIKKKTTTNDHPKIQR